MKIEWTGEHSAKVTVDNPDERMKQYFAQKFRDAYDAEFSEFLDEVRVAMRKMQLGQTITISSKPIVVNIESPGPVAVPASAVPGGAK